LPRFNSVQKFDTQGIKLFGRHFCDSRSLKFLDIKLIEKCRVLNKTQLTF
jgi:hypothetical protein